MKLKCLYAHWFSLLFPQVSNILERVGHLVRSDPLDGIPQWLMMSTNYGLYDYEV